MKLVPIGTKVVYKVSSVESVRGLVSGYVINDNVLLTVICVGGVNVRVPYDDVYYQVGISKEKED